MDLAKHCRQIADSMIDEFKFPDWVITNCPSCFNETNAKAIISVQIHFEPIFLGDMSFTYHCSHCHAIFIMHVQCNINTPYDFVKILNSKNKYHLINRDELLKSGHHNIFVNMTKDNK